MKKGIVSFVFSLLSVVSFGQKASSDKNVLLKQIRQQQKKLLSNPQNTKSLSLVALDYYKLNDLVKAIGFYNRLIDLDPKYSGAFANRGVCKLLTGDKPGACHDFAQSVNNGEDRKIIENKKLSEYLATECENQVR